MATDTPPAVPVISALGQHALAGTDLDALFDEAVQGVADTLETAYAKVLRYRSEPDDLELVAGVGWSAGLVGTATVGAGVASQAGYTLRTTDPVVVADLQTETRFSGPPLLHDHDVVSGVSVIIGPLDDPWGVLGAHTTRRRQFTDHDIDFVQSVANILTSVIERRERDCRFRAVFEEAFDAMAIANDAGDYIDVNAAACELFGVEHDELLGRSAAEFAPADVDGAATWQAFQSSEQERGTFPLVRSDGETRVVEAAATTDIVPGEHLSVLRDVTEQEHKQRALETSENRYRSLTDDVLDTSQVGTFILNADFEVVWINEAIEEYFGIDREAVLGADKSRLVEATLKQIFEDGDGFADRVLATYADNTDTEQFECHVLADGARQDRYLEHWSQPIGSGLYEGGRIEHYTDITESRQRERALEDLGVATRNLMRARTPDDIHDLAVEAATDIIDLSGVAIYAFDPGRNVLAPAASSPDTVALLGELPTLDQGEGITWDVFMTQEPIYVPDLHDHEDRLDIETPVRTLLAVPLDNHGVFLAGMTTVDAYDEVDIELATILATTLEAALDRAEREEAIRDRDRRLADQNDTLEQLEHLNSVVRDTLRTVVSAATRTEIEQLVCDRLTNTDPYCSSWIGEYDPVTEGLESRTWAGFDAPFFDHHDGDKTLYTLHLDLAQQAIETGTVQVDQNILATASEPSERRAALARGVQSVAMVPLVAPDHVLGVFAIYAREPNAFTDRETAVLVETGSVLGRAMHERDRMQAVLTETSLELDLELRDSRCFFSRLAVATGGRIDLEGMVPRGASLVSFVTLTDGDPTSALDLADSWTALETVDVVSSSDERHLLRLVSCDVRFTEPLRDRGGSIASATATGDTVRASVRLPSGTNVRGLLEAYQDQFADVELMARHEATGTTEATLTMPGIVLDELTERQREAFYSAYHSGYFEVPRRTQGDVLADMMGISSPTFHSHLRAALQKLATAIFEAD